MLSTPEGDKCYAALISARTAFSSGLIGEAIVGVVERPNEPITPDNFTANSVCHKFLAEVIGRHGPQDPDLQAEAARIGDGQVFVIDQRTPTPDETVPPYDIMGAFRIENGKAVAGSYVVSPNHRLLSPDGFFRLSPFLDDCLQQELAARAAAPA